MNFTFFDAAKYGDPPTYIDCARHGLTSTRLSQTDEYEVEVWCRKRWAQRDARRRGKCSKNVEMYVHATCPHCSENIQFMFRKAEK